MKKKLSISIAVLLLLACVAGIMIHRKNVAYQNWYNAERVKENVTIEVGESSIDIKDFLLDQKEQAVFLKVPEIDFSKPGTYELTVHAGPRDYNTSLTIKDTIPPTLEVKDLTVPIKTELEAEDFIVKSEDLTPLTFELVWSGDASKPGEHDVKLIATDLGNNKAEQAAKVRFVSVVDKIEAECGELKKLEPMDFVLGGTLGDIKFITDITKINLNKVATTKVEVIYNGTHVFIPVIIKDTSSPKGDAVAVKAYQGQKISANQFVTNIKDNSNVKVYFGSKPNVNSIGTQKVSVILEDEGKNQTKLSSSLTIERDNVAPVIKGARNIRVTSTSGANLRNGVYAIDNVDGRLAVSVDSSRVNVNKEGTYTLIYSTQDRNKNKAVKQVTVTVDFITPYAPSGSTGSAALDNLCDRILSRLVNNDMSVSSKMRKIYGWTSGNIAYSGSASKAMIPSAIQGLTTRRGNCYTRANVLRALFARIGVGSSLGQEYRGMHAWAQIGGRVYDTGFGRYGTPLSSLQHVKSHDVYMYRTTAYDPNVAKEGYRLETKTTKIPFKTEYIEDPNLPLGTTKVVQEGEDGSLSITVQIRLRDGRRTQTERAETPPINQIIAKGTGTGTGTGTETPPPSETATGGNEGTVTPPPTETVGGGTDVVETKEISETIKIEKPQTVYMTDSNLAYGETKTVTGKSGEKVIYYRIQLLNGKETSRTVIREEVTVQPYPDVIFRNPDAKPANP
ncbi:G5 domain-containing protein [Guggenheimella bovis]